MDEREIAAREAELIRMFSMFSDKPDADRLRGYLEELVNYPFPVFKKAVRSATRNQQSEWVPSVGKIISCAGHFLQEYRDQQDELREQQELEMGKLLKLVPPKT
jgi:hypothetical protein